MDTFNLLTFCQAIKKWAIKDYTESIYYKHRNVIFLKILPDYISQFCVPHSLYVLKKIYRSLFNK